MQRPGSQNEHAGKRRSRLGESRASLEINGWSITHLNNAATQFSCGQGVMARGRFTMKDRGGKKSGARLRKGTKIAVPSHPAKKRDDFRFNFNASRDTYEVSRKGGGV